MSPSFNEALELFEGASPYNDEIFQWLKKFIYNRETPSNNSRASLNDGDVSPNFCFIPRKEIIFLILKVT